VWSCGVGAVFPWWFWCFAGLGTHRTVVCHSRHTPLGPSLSEQSSAACVGVFGSLCLRYRWFFSVTFCVTVQSVTLGGFLGTFLGNSLSLSVAFSAILSFGFFFFDFFTLQHSRFGPIDLSRVLFILYGFCSCVC
jgi:hypothetical protein